jgi:hypothetical protein
MKQKSSFFQKSNLTTFFILISKIVYFIEIGELIKNQSISPSLDSWGLEFFSLNIYLKMKILMENRIDIKLFFINFLIMIIFWIIRVKSMGICLN